MAFEENRRIARNRSQAVKNLLGSRFFARGLILVAVGVSLSTATTLALSQSGRQKPPLNSNANTNRPKQPTQSNSTKKENAQAKSNTNTEDDSPDVVRVSATLVPVPTTVLDTRGIAIVNLKLEDFELSVDGQPNPISDLTRSESPVRMAMLFDNSGSLDASRDFEKRAATHFFAYVLRPMDQAAIYSFATDVELAQPMTNDVRRLQQTIESFGKPDGSTSLYDAMLNAARYLRPFAGRRVIIIVSDGRDTTSHLDFDQTIQRMLADDCQIYVVQTGIYDNANVRDLAAERRMQEFAAQTGGAAYIPRSVSDLEDAFTQIAADLAQQYVLSYYPAADKRDGKYHVLAVRVKQPNARVRARKGFLVKRDRV